MKIYGIVEEKIRAAIENGEFDNLPNKGKPLDLTEWQKTPEQHRMAYSILKSSGYTPPEVNMKNEIGELKKLIKETTDPDEKMRLMNKLNAAMVGYSLRMERMNKR